MSPIKKTFERFQRVLSKGPQNRGKLFLFARAIYRLLPLSGGTRVRLRNFFKTKILGLTPGSYAEWIARYDTLTEIDRTAIQNHISTFKKLPLISVVMPTYNSPETFLIEAIESVRSQIYIHWELCIADDASSAPHIRRILEKYSAKDPRIKVCFRERNGHISAASNSALDLATGEFVALLDHDDEISEHALYWIASEILAHPNADLIYSDEDKIDEKGRRFDPNFKPDWNPELLLGQNYICHLGAYRREKILKIGGFREELEGAQDWDMVLRFTEDLNPDNIRHIPAVLYHWRSIPTSTAGSMGAKSYATQAQVRSLTEALARRGEDATVESICEGTYWLPHFKVRGEPLVSVIIPTRNGLDLLRRCIDSLGGTEYTNIEVIIVDNQSDDQDTIAYLSQIGRKPNFRVLPFNQPFDFAALHNWAVPQAKGEFLCLLNNDTEVISPSWLTDMIAVAQRPGIGAVGAKLLYPDGSIQHGGIILGIGGVAGHAHKGFLGTSYGYFGRAALLQSYSAVTGACLLIEKIKWDEIGGMDTNLSVAFNDVDLCLRLREKGLRNIVAPGALLSHHESKTRGFDTHGKKLIRFAKENLYMQWRWGAVLDCDPAYNPNLSLIAEDFSLAWPPRLHAPWKIEPTMVDIPFGFNVVSPEFISLLPDSDLSGKFLLPCHLHGQLEGLSLLVEIPRNSSDGIIIIELTDGEHTTHGRAFLSTYGGRSVVPFRFPERTIPLFGQESLSFRIRLTSTTAPIALCAYTLNKKWANGIVKYPEKALRIVLHVSKTEREDLC